MLFRLGVVLSAVVFSTMACTSGALRSNFCHAEELKIREAVVRHLLRIYDEMEPQFDDPVGRRYCLGFDFRLGKGGKAAPLEFVQRFSDHPNVHSFEWCTANDGRVVSVGPVQCKSTRAEVWSFSWVESRPGGTDCRHAVIRRNSGWEVQEGCLQGLIYG